MARSKPPARRRKSRPTKRRPAARPTRAAARRRTKPGKKAQKPRKPARPKPRAATRPARRAGKPRPAARKPRSVPGSRPKPVPAGRQAPLERRRRQLSDTERLSGGRNTAEDRLLSSARAGHNEIQAQMDRHTESSPALAGGDIDAKWEEAYALGDEAPGGDNMTPGQDRVDDIGKALGINYEDNQELQGGDEVTERDKHRWELDPASSDDWPHNKK
jgi:hypothetical protein